ncbi:leucine rich repeat-containing protein, partial [Toxoplasma gondii MAS]
MEVGPSVQSPRTRCFSGVAEQLDAAMPAPVQDGQVDSMSTSDFSCSSSLLVEGAGANRSVDCLRGQLDSRGKAETQNFSEQLEGNSQYLTTAIGLIGKQADSFHGPASLAHPADRCEHAEGGVNFSAERRPRGFMGLERDRKEADEREGERARKRWRGAERTRQQVHVERKSFAELPQEVLELIFSRLGLADLSRCLCVAKSWHPPLNAVFAKTIVSLGTSRRLLLTDAQLEALLKRCPAVHTVELDCFLLTPRGAALLGNAPSLVSLSLTSVDHQTDEFFYALADVISGIESFSVAIFDRSKHITNAALEHLAGRLQKLQAFSVEISFRENLDFFVLALTRASAGTLRHVTLYDVSEECLVQLTAAIGKNLLSFSYTKTSSTSLPISDWLLQYLPLRMPRLTSLRLVDAVTPGVLAQVSSPFSSLFVSARRRRRRRRETELDRERVRERGRARERGREREREQERERGREQERERGREQGREREREQERERERDQEREREQERDQDHSGSGIDRDEPRVARERGDNRERNGRETERLSSTSAAPLSSGGAPRRQRQDNLSEALEQRGRRGNGDRIQEEEEEPPEEPRGHARSHGVSRNSQRLCFEKVPPLVSPAGLSCLRPLAGNK